MNQTDSDDDIKREPPLVDQMREVARDDPDRTDLTNMLHDLSHVTGVLVDGEDEDWRDTVISVMFDDKGYRDTGDVIDIMRLAGWRPEHVTFAPYNRIGFMEVDE